MSSSFMLLLLFFLLIHITVTDILVGYCIVLGNCYFLRFPQLQIQKKLMCMSSTIRIHFILYWMDLLTTKAVPKMIRQHLTDGYIAQNGKVLDVEKSCQINSFT